MDNRPIGIFDSGLGGLSVLRVLEREMPRERFLYFGDSANAPYGSRPTAQVRELTLSHVDELMRLGLEAVVFAPLHEPLADTLLVLRGTRNLHDFTKPVPHTLRLESFENVFLRFHRYVLFIDCFRVQNYAFSRTWQNNFA